MCEHWKGEAVKVLLCCLCLMCVQSSPLLVYVKPIVHAVVFLCFVCVYCSIGLDQAHSTFCCVLVFCVCPLQYWSRSGPQYILLCSCVLCVSSPLLVQIRPTVHSVAFLCFVCVHCSIGQDQAHSTRCCVPCVQFTTGTFFFFFLVLHFPLREILTSCMQTLEIFKLPPDIDLHLQKTTGTQALDVIC